MAKTKQMEGGRVVSFYLGDPHVRALDLFRERHGHRSRAAALRAVLEVVAEVEACVLKSEVFPVPE